MITVNCEYRIKEDIGFIIEAVLASGEKGHSGSGKKGQLVVG